MKTGKVLCLLVVLTVMLVNVVFSAPLKDVFPIRPKTGVVVADKEELLRTPVMEREIQALLPEAKTRSVAKAFVLSLLVPGTGQFYAQAPGRGRLFMGTELAVLSGYLGFRLYSDWKEEDYRLYAAAHASVDPRGKSEDYFEDVSLYMTMEDYNRQQLHNFREDAELYSGTDFWEWDSDRSRQKFDSLFRASSNAKDNAIIMTGLGLLNHLLSAVDAARTARIYNKQNTSGARPIRFTFQMKPTPESFAMMIGLERTF